VRVREHGQELSECGTEIMAVGFSPAEALAGLAEYLEWPWLFLSDVERIMYHKLGLGRLPLREVWTPGTKAIYRQAREKGEAIHLPVEDPLQLGGDAVVADGKVVRVFIPSSPDDRPPVADLVAAVRTATGQ